MDPNQHHNALNRHDMLHWYEIQSILGQGGFGITYLARDTNLDQLVAIKEYLPTEFSTRDKANTVQPISENHAEIFDWGKKRFLEEAKTLAQFRHPNVVRVSSFFENNNTGYMVMDYEEGADLAGLIKSGETFNEQRVLDLLLPILDGLGEIHAQGFIHRDIKPANIFIRNDGSPVLIDFGSARQAIGGQTKTMTSLVTPGFAPFEQYHDAEGKQGPWTDIYSLGATSYSMITGKPPIDALKRGMARIDHSTDAYLHLTDLRAGKYSTHLLLAIDCALEFMEANRPQDVFEWRAMLLGEIEVPQANIATQLRDTAAADQGPARDEMTRIVTRPNDETPTTEPHITTVPVTSPDAVTVQATAPPAAAAPKAEPAKPQAQAEPEVKPVEAPPQAPAVKKSKAKTVIIVAASFLLILAALVLVSRTNLLPSPGAETASTDATELKARQAEEARLAADREALNREQASLAAEKEKLQQELARIESDKKQQAEQAQQAAEKEAQRKQQARLVAEQEKLKQEQARIAAEKKRQAELARKKAAEEKHRQELARKQAEQQKRAQELAQQQAALAQQQLSAAAVNIAGTYVPDKGFEGLVLTQKGNRVKGTIGTDGSSLEGVINGNRLEFKFNYSRTGYGFKDGFGVMTLSADGKRLTGTRSQGGFPPGTVWKLTRSDGAPRKAAALNPLTDASGVYSPDDGFEDLKLQQTGNKIKGTIGTNGSTLEGRREGNTITFAFNYSRTGYGFKNGHGQFTISADGRRLTGSRNGAGFRPNSSWNLRRTAGN